MSNRYSKYSATLGGETFRWSVEGGLGPGAGERLTEMGIPIRVKFAFNLIVSSLMLRIQLCQSL